MCYRWLSHNDIDTDLYTILSTHRFYYIFLVNHTLFTYNVDLKQIVFLENFETWNFNDKFMQSIIHDPSTNINTEKHFFTNFICKRSFQNY